MTHWKIWKTNS